MKTDLLRKHISQYLADKAKDPHAYSKDLSERRDRIAYYRSWTAAKIRCMTPDDLLEYISRLWAMRIWGNKQYVVSKLIDAHGIENVRDSLADLLWSKELVEKRWDTFRKTITGIGPAMMSELLCHVEPDKYLLWNRRAYVALNYLDVPGLPRYDYQLTGAKYAELCATASEIAKEMQAAGDKDTTLLAVDYFLWDELQVEENLSQIHKSAVEKPMAKADAKTQEFIHNEVRDKIAEIGQWLGLQSRTEVKVSKGAVVDATWEATIGNMGRVIYAFEVQTKGSIDSLILNLRKSLNNPAVQAVVAVSDSEQLKKIKAEAEAMNELVSKLKTWDYTQVLQVHESLEYVNEAINSLGLVPESFK